MTFFRFTIGAPAAVISLALLNGCGGAQTSANAPTEFAPQALTRLGPPGPKANRDHWRPSVFVSTGSYVTQFAAKNDGKVLNVIKSGTGNATGLAADPEGNLWVDSWATYGAVEFTPNTTTPSRIISEDEFSTLPNGIAICNDDNVYVSNFLSQQSDLGSIDIYNYQTLYRTGQIGAPNLQYGYFVQCDKHSNVYIDYLDKSGGVHFMEYPPGGTGTGTNLPIKLVSAVDFKILPSGDIVVPADATVDFYHPGKATAYRRISGFSGAFAVAFSKHDTRMWVLDGTANVVYEVAVDSGKIIGSLGEGELYSPGDVVAFPPG